MTLSSDFDPLLLVGSITIVGLPSDPSEFISWELFLKSESLRNEWVRRRFG